MIDRLAWHMAGIVLRVAAAGKEVLLHGVAKEPTRLPLLNLKSYVSKDDSGEIAILTEGDLPKVNEEISVRVKVANIAIINGKPLGTTITEIARR